MSALGDAINKAAKETDPFAIRAINYQDTGSILSIVLVRHFDDARIMCISNSDGSIDTTLCPCCMTKKTREDLMHMIKSTNVTKIVWKSVYSHSVNDYFPDLILLKLGKEESEYSVRR